MIRFAKIDERSASTWVFDAWLGVLFRFRGDSSGWTGENWLELRPATDLYYGAIGASMRSGKPVYPGDTLRPVLYSDRLGYEVGVELDTELEVGSFFYTDHLRQVTRMEEGTCYSRRVSTARGHLIGREKILELDDRTQRIVEVERKKAPALP